MAKQYEYHQIFMPDNEMAYKNKCISEHRYVASKKLGRPLKRTEVVHHIDEDKSNNSPENLMVFRTNADHTAFHKGRRAILDGDVYCCPEMRTAYKCIVCGNAIVSGNGRMCCSCYREKNKSKMPCTKDELFELVLKYPFVKIAEKFNVSDNCIRKWCKKNGIPYKYHDIRKIKKELGM